MSAPLLVLGAPLLLGLSCAPRHRAESVQPGDSVAARAAGLAEVRYRPAFDVPPGDPDQLVHAVTGGQWDQGLASAAADLLALHVDRGSRIDAGTASQVAARAGFPGQARFLRTLNGGAFPQDLVDELIGAAPGGGPIDLGLARRQYEDGTSLWILGWSRHLADLDPILRDPPLDQALPLRVDPTDPAMEDADLRLYLAPPDGPVEELSLSPGVARWVDHFHTPGEWRVEAVADHKGRESVLLLFSLFVDAVPPTPAPLSSAPATVENPVQAEQALFTQLNALRASHGLAPVSWFPLFEPLVREQSAFMAAAGRAAHVLPGVTPGVAAKAHGYAFPFAFHHEAVATAPTAQEAMDLVVDSPAHRATLLCQACTMATIGVALEPVLDRPPRMFVTWELIETPKGTPRLIDNLDR